MPSDTPNLSLSRPDKGSVGWYDDINNNFTDLDTILGRFEREEHTLNDTSSAAIAGGEAVLARAFLFDETNSDVADCFLTGSDGQVLGLKTTDGAFGQDSQGTDGQTNLYWDAGTAQYEIENQTGGSATYEIVLIRSIN